MKHLKNQSGALVLEIILGIIAVAAVGYIIYGQLTHKKATQTTSPSPVAVESIPTSDPYAGWKTYNSTYEGVTFNYPADWKAEASISGGALDEDLTLTSPSGYALRWRAPVPPLGGGCDKSSPHTFVTSVERLVSNSSAKPLYIVQGKNSGYQTLGLVDEIGNKPPVVGDTGTCLVILNFKSKKHPEEAGVQFSTQAIVGQHKDGDTSSKMSDAEYANQPEVKIAKLIMASLTYK